MLFWVWWFVSWSVMWWCWVVWYGNVWVVFLSSVESMWFVSEIGVVGRRFMILIMNFKWFEIDCIV